MVYQQILLLVYLAFFTFRVNDAIPIWGKASFIKNPFILQKSAIRSIFRFFNKQFTKKKKIKKNIKNVKIIKKFLIKKMFYKVEKF